MGDQGVEWLAAYERELWITALVLYGVGDATTTAVGLSVTQVAEVGPIAGPLIAEHGHVALLVVKLATFGLFAAVWRLVRRPTRVAVPLAASAVGMVVTAWNLAVIVSAAG